MYFDYLKNNLNLNADNKNDEILVAPSWNFNEKNFINKDFEKIIEKLLYYNFKVRFRPHPEHFKRSPFFLDEIKNKFKSKNFIFDNNIENVSSMLKAKCLITDNSGIAVEYTSILKRPTLYYESNFKIHNKEIKDYKSLKVLEDIVKKKFGLKFKYNQIEKLNTIINLSLKNFNNVKRQKRIKKFTKENFYNFLTINDFIKKNINKIIY